LLLSPGEKLGPYEILAQVGAGGMPKSLFDRLLRR